MASAPELLARFEAFLGQYPDVSQICVAYSGGLDSTVLLDLSERCRGARRLSAIHINHGLHPDAADWASHCRSQCQARGIELSCIEVTLDVPDDVSPEAAAREARYGVFENSLAPGQALLTAHHLDDQAETVLLRALRGAGPEGLGGIPVARALGQGWILRPLLDVTRKELHDYALARGLLWVEDSSNALTDVDRNLLRHQIMPALARRWPAASRSLQLSARLCREAAMLNRELADLDLVAARVHGIEHALALEPLKALGEARQRNALRHWLASHGHGDIGHHLLMELTKQLLHAREDAEPLLCWRDVEVRRYRDRLYLQRILPEPEAGSEALVIEARAGPVELAGNGTLHVHTSGGDLLVPETACVGLRYRRPGEGFRLAGRPKKSYKQLMQEAGVPPWLRHRLPVIEVDNCAAAIVGIGVCEGFVADSRTAGWWFTWQLGPWQF